MATDIGINFRQTSGYVTDPAGYTYCLPTDSYPTSRATWTFGWSVAGSIDARDRSTTNNHRLAGFNFIGSGGSPATFRLDLPSTGSTDVYLAFGDANNAQVIKATVRDNATTFITITNVSSVDANEYVDATGAHRTESQWLADSANGGTAVNRTFGSTILFIDLLAPSSLNTCLCTLFVHQAGGGGGGGSPMRRNSSLNGLGASGPFFHNPLRHQQPDNRGFVRRDRIFVPAHYAKAA